MFKKKRRKGYRRKAGHRQHQTVVRITEILTDGKAPSAKAAPKTAKAKKAAPEEAPVEAPVEAPEEAPVEAAVEAAADTKTEE